MYFPYVCGKKYKNMDWVIYTIFMTVSLREEKIREIE